MDHPRILLVTSKGLTEIQAHKQGHKAQLMQADTVATTTKPQNQAQGGDFPASLFLFPPFTSRLYPYPHLSPSLTFICIIVV